MAAQGQAQAVRQREITRTESVALVRVLVRVAMFETAYHRGLFPDSYFTPVRMNAMDGMYVNVLRGADDDARTLLSWERGVTDALEKGYLKTLLFGIALDADCSEIVEEYVFSFDSPSAVPGLAVKTGGAGSQRRVLLPAGGAASSAAGGGVGGGGGGGGGATEADRVRYEVSRLLRMLVTVTRTLEKVPEDRYLFAKILFTDGTPHDYEPPLFEAAAGDAAAGFFPRRPFTMRLGSVQTPHHTVALAVKSTLDAGGGGGGGGETAGAEEEAAASAGGAPAGGGGGGGDGQGDDGDGPVAEPLGSTLLDGCESDMDEVEAPAMAAAAATDARDKIYGDASTAFGGGIGNGNGNSYGRGGARGGGGGGGPGVGASVAPPAPIPEEPEHELEHEQEQHDEAMATDALVARLRRYCGGRASVSFAAAMSAPVLSDAPVARIEAAFAVLVAGGVLAPLRHGGDAYVVVSAAAAAAAAAAARMGSLTIGGGGGGSGAAAAAAAAEPAPTVVAVSGGAVCVSADVTMAEDQDEADGRTVQQQQQHQQRQQQPKEQDAAAGVFFASQRSARGAAAGAAAKKASVVAKPIRQTRGGRVAKVAAGAPSSAAPSAPAKVAAAVEAAQAAAAAAAPKPPKGAAAAAAAKAAASRKPPAGAGAGAGAGGGRPVRNRRAPSRT